MPKATPEQTRKANKAAAIVAAVVTVFALAFCGTVAALDKVATVRQEQEVVIADQVPINPYYVLLIGSDTRKGTALYTGKPTEHAQVDQHSDVMTLMRIDPRTYKVSLLTIPRDTVIAEGGEKINNSLLDDDPQKVIEAVYELTGLRADYYMVTTFGLFADLVDALGGIRMDVVRDVTMSDPTTGGSITVKAGKNRKLNGSEALALARARSEYETDQDAVRQMNVRNIEQALIEKILGGEGVGIEALMVVMEHDVSTDMDLSVMGLSILDFMEHADEVTLYSGTGPYSGDVRADDGQWVVENDAELWHDIMQEFKHGNDFSQFVNLPEVKPEKELEKASSGSAKSASSRSSKTADGTASAKKGASSKASKGRAS